MRAPSPAALIVLSLSLASAAAAQPAPSRANKVAADTLFDEGMRLMAEKKYPEACVKFEESNRLDPGIGILLYLGDCYRLAGRSASAWTTFREAAGSARMAGQADREKTALRLASELEPTLSRMILLVKDRERQPGLILRHNGVIVSHALWGTALPVDPGEQRIEASCEGKQPWSTRVEIREPGQTVTIPVPLLLEATPPPPASALPAATSAATPSPASASPLGPVSPASPRRTAALVAGGLGLLGVGVGAYLGLRTFSLWDESRADCPGNRCTTDTSFDAATQARRSGNLSTLFFGLGAAGLGAGAWLWFSAPSSPRLAVAPGLSPQGGGLTARGSW